MLSSARGKDPCPVIQEHVKPNRLVRTEFHTATIGMSDADSDSEIRAKHEYRFEGGSNPEMSKSGLNMQYPS